MSIQVLIKNGMILQSNGTFIKGHVGIDRGIIAALYYGDILPEDENVRQIDAEGLMVCPGFIDTHIHGGNGFDFSYETGEWEKLEEYLSSSGVTSILAAICSRPPEETLRLVDRAVMLAKKNESSNVEIAGIHMEGPYLNKNKNGVHQIENIRPAEKEEINRILGHADGLIKIWTLAPDIKENMAAIETLVSAGISVSIAHTEAGYETAMKAFSLGMNRVTHTFNTMPLLHQRYEGIVTAAWQHGAFMELISDGWLVSPTIAKMFIAATDPGKLVLVSDNNEFSGFPDGSYFQDNCRITISNGRMTNEDGALVGSVISLNQCAYNLTHWGFSAGTALKMAAENPARSIGIFDRKGSIASGKDADIVLLDGQFAPAMTIKGGRIVYCRGSYVH
ncbi:MAG: N-acetylglucosamine-6-phosphate deacetylase [Treponema sp.]|jgi:N-acetylglucosamine-6-phosphate deacetylase|nr:N-acetylglucosamine-6-phosphate deacetylase [Treponema sp.]